MAKSKQVCCDNYYDLQQHCASILRTKSLSAFPKQRSVTYARVKLQSCRHLASTEDESVLRLTQTMLEKCAQEEKIFGKSNLAAPADLIRCQCQLSQAPRDDAECATRAMQERGVRVIRLKYDNGKEVAKMTFHRVYQNRRSNVSCSFANATSDGMSPYTQTSSGTNLQNEEIR